MGKSSSAKGKCGERELATLLASITGLDVRRRVRQHCGDDDLVGVPGWAIECKRAKAAGRGQIARWWLQAAGQAGQDQPVLFYRLDRDSWRAVWSPIADTAVVVEADAATWWRINQARTTC